MAKGIFAGSFDPFTKGHLYIVKLASALFENLIICIATNPLKEQRMFKKEGMKQAIEETLKAENITNCKVICYEGDIVNLAKQEGAKFVIRGMRSAGDFDYEELLAKEYYKGGLETIYASSGSYIENGNLSKISSTSVREKVCKHEPIHSDVPKAIEEFILENKP